MQVTEMMEDLLIEFDEYSFAPRITMPNAEEYALEWKERLISAIEKFRARINELAGDFVKGYEAGVNEGWNDAVEDTVEKIWSKIDKFCLLEKKEFDERCKDLADPEFVPETIESVHLSDLLFIAQILKKDARLLARIKDGYTFGHAAGYNSGLALFQKGLHKAILKTNIDPIRLERGNDFDFTKVKFEIPPYKQHDEVINMARLYGMKITDTPKYIKAVIPSTDGEGNK